MFKIKKFFTVLKDGLFPKKVNGAIVPSLALEALIWQDNKNVNNKNFIFPSPTPNDEVFLNEEESREKRNALLNDPWFQERLKSLHLSEITLGSNPLSKDYGQGEGL